MDHETIRTLTRERGCRATNLITLAPPIMRYFDTTLGSRDWKSYCALTAMLENQQQAIVDNREEIQALQAEHVQLTQAFEQQMQPHQACLVDLWHTIERDLGASTSNREDCLLPVAHDDNEYPNGLYDSAYSYSEQLIVYKAFQSKGTAGQGMEDKA